MEARWGIERKKTNRYVCNQWQVGNFLTQKQVKAGEGYFQVCTTQKLFLAVALVGSQPLWLPVGF
jgi:hypothetical protein